MGMSGSSSPVDPPAPSPPVPSEEASGESSGIPSRPRYADDHEATATTGERLTILWTFVRPYLHVLAAGLLLSLWSQPWAWPAPWSPNGCWTPSLTADR